jgi:cytoskeletal protein CcmA (bactofilin family)
MAQGELNIPSPDERQVVICLYCNKPQEVGRKTLSMTCKFCNKSLRLQDIPVKGYEARRSIETLGIVTVEKKGNVVTDKILCGGVVVRGKVKGNIRSRGPVLVSPEAEIRGDITAPTLAVGAGAVLEGRYNIGPETPAAPAMKALPPANGS